MDHLILPERVRHPVETAVMLDPGNYDGRDFFEYPDTQGWGERTAGEWLRIFEMPSPRFVAFLERWLLFGNIHTLCSYYRVRFNPLDFLGPPDIAYGANSRTLNTQRLPTLLQQIRNSFLVESPLSTNDYNSLLSTLQASFLLHAFLSDPPDEDASVNHADLKLSLHNFINQYRFSIRNPRSPEITLATSTIMESFRGILLSTLLDLPTMNFPSVDIIMRDKLRQDGWCPSEVSRLLSKFTSPALYFIYQFTRPRPNETHHAIRIWDSSHKLLQGPPINSPTQLCTPYQCAHRQLVDSGYQTSHVDTCDGQACFDIVADLDELCEILERGKIPLIHIIEENDKSSKIIFEEYDPKKNEKGLYVAISHVWSDGLGNLHQNALPRCQLRRLSDLVKALPGDYSARLFWCDTICIPPDSVNRPKAQSCALDQMRTVYSKPKTVLVLDSWLLESSMQGKRDIETLMRIFACTWNTRLWTYQEGALPKSLHFQFADGSYDLDIGMRTAENASTNIVEQADIVIPLRARWNSLRCFKDKRQIAERLSAIANELGYRTTSVATDEALCLAVLLDLDAGKIFETDPDLRMQEIWKASQFVPRKLAFTHLETFETHGLRWAPKTFLQSSSNMARDGTPWGESWTSSDAIVERTADGICIQEIGIRFVREDGDFSGLFILRDQNQRFYHIAVETSYVGNITWEQFAILLDCTIDHFQSTWMFTDDTETKSFGGILVGILSIGDFVHCQRLEVCKVTVLGHEAAAIPREILPPIWQWGNSYYLCYEDGIRNCVKDAQLMPLQQKWCIG